MMVFLITNKFLVCWTEYSLLHVCMYYTWHEYILYIIYYVPHVHYLYTLHTGVHTWHTYIHMKCMWSMYVQVSMYTYIYMYVHDMYVHMGTCTGTTCVHKYISEHPMKDFNIYLFETTRVRYRCSKICIPKRSE